LDEKDDRSEETMPPEAPEASGESSPGPEAPAADGAGFAGERAEAEEGSVLPPREVRAIVEALVFACPQPITPREIGRVLVGVPREDWQRELEALRDDYRRDERGLQLIEVAGGWQVTTRPEYNDWVRELIDPRTPTRLSIQALETLAVIAYRQPVTLPEIIELRGVRSSGVVKTLLEKRLIRIMGRKEVVGRPMLYGTTKQFLLHFGLKDLEELPQIEEFVEILGEEVDVPGLKRAIEAPLPAAASLAEEDEVTQATLFDEPGGQPGSGPESADHAGTDGVGTENDLAIEDGAESPTGESVAGGEPAGTTADAGESRDGTPDEPDREL
jgi:segregation and condensation protein B